MPRLRVEGLPAVSRELERIRKAQAPAIAAAVEAATSFGHKLAVDEVYRRYGFRERAYVEQHLTVSFNPRTLEGRVIGRYRPSSLSRFIVRENTRTSKRGGKLVRDGLTIASIRNQPNWLKGAFTYIGRNGNRLVTQRSRGDNSWRSLKGRKTLYGPSVAGSFAVIRSQIEAPIIQHLRDRYRQLAK